MQNLKLLLRFLRYEYSLKFQVLFSEDKGYILITAISEVATGKIQEDLVKSVLQLMDAHGESMRLFETVISKEIDKTSLCHVLS